jgi:hypothetical protein
MKFAFSFFIVASLLVCAIPVAGAPRHTGVEGFALIYRGPIFDGLDPVALARRPAVTSFTIIEAHSGDIVAEGTTDATGAFSVRLHPGDYVLIPTTLADLSPRPGAPRSDTPEPIEFTVHHKQFTRVDFAYVFPIVRWEPPPTSPRP